MSLEIESLVTIADPRSPVSEAYRTLRTNIQFSSLDRPVRTLLVTSTSAAEGKSTTIANLAVTFASAGNQVVLVDSDLRRPSLDGLFGLNNAKGLTSIMLDDSDPTLVLQPTQVDRLRVLTSGPLPPNPSELLGSQRLDRILKTLSESVDLVLLDCPPIIAVTDAAVLARKVDAVLLVVNAGKTRREHAARARQLLDKVNANVLGVVLNNAQTDTSLYQYYG
ncbi:MAG TPA: CpsD/CapB family tyrosine-protein kinase [Chloroflexota bacterium]|nr:CpsD/CapB family tyrosine-protein kinase [Chloroflexota bacterium]